MTTIRIPLMCAICACMEERVAYRVGEPMKDRKIIIPPKVLCEHGWTKNCRQTGYDREDVRRWIYFKDWSVKLRD